MAFFRCIKSDSIIATVGFNFDQIANGKNEIDEVNAVVLQNRIAPHALTHVIGDTYNGIFPDIFIDSLVKHTAFKKSNENLKLIIDHTRENFRQ